MELKYFRLIKTIVEHGNIANSSEQLFLTQSALSHQLREMEDRLGYKVFYRRRNHWTLTPEGEELYKMATQLLQTLAEGFQNIQQIKEGARGTLKVSAECHSFFHGLPAFVQKMGILYPEINIDLSMGATHHTISQLLSNDLDVAIVTSRPVSDKLYAIKIFEDEIRALLHQEHPFATLELLDASHFAELHLIINSFPLENVSVYEHFLKPNRIIPRKVSAIPYTEVALELVRANMGTLCMPDWMLHPFQLSPDIIRKKISKNGLKRAHYLVIRKEQKSLEYFNTFINNFIDDFSNLT